MRRATLLASAAIGGLAFAITFSAVPEQARLLMGLQVPAAAAEPAAAAKPDSQAEGRESHGEEGHIAMTGEQVEASGIVVAAVGGGQLLRHATVPAVLGASQDRQARVTPRLGGVVAEVRRSLGDEVAQGEVLAVLESREVADAKGEFLAAGRTAALAETLLARESRLWRQRVSAEQDFLQARATAEDARIKLDLARQRLLALGLAEAEIAALPRQPAASLRRLELRAPIAGRVTARAAILGGNAAADAELFSVADLSVLWVEMTIPPRDLPMARQGQAVAIQGEGEARAEARIIFLSPVLDPETRSARAVAALPNPDGAWSAGGFVTAQLTTGAQPVDLMVPRGAVQEVEGKQVVFLRNEEGFEMREVALGREDAENVEVIFGLDEGARIAVGNAFVLRAELGKSEAGHGH